jgi:Domain of unknown function (DUF4917)
MAPPILSFAQALHESGDDPSKRHVLLGNGFSRACLEDTFAYDALRSRADFTGVSPTAWQAFDALGTSDFEVVMRGLTNAAKVALLYLPPDAPLVHQLRTDAQGLKDVLIQAIAHSHPDHPFEIDAARYAACKRFLHNFTHLYTLNYDLLLYWAVMRTEIEPAIDCDDGFRTPEDNEGAEYVVWEPDSFKNQNIHYLHGALHLFDSGSDLQKYTWVNTGVRLIDQVRDAMNHDLFPVFVSEGESQQKLIRIRHSAYLSRAERSLYGLGNNLFVYGHSFAENDDHILRAIARSSLRRLFVSIYGDPNNDANQFIIRRAMELSESRSKKKPLAVQFYGAETAAVWG